MGKLMGAQASGPLRARKGLTARGIRSLPPGWHSDAGREGVPGLYIRVADTGAGYWFFRFMLRGRRRDMGLGSSVDVSLAEAREMALQARKLKRQGIDPIDHRNEAQAAQERAQVASTMTFERAAREVHETLAPGWKNPKHADQWINTLAAYAFPRIGDMPVGSIGVAEVLEVLKPIWQDKAETARRVRQRMDQVMRWAEAHGHAEKNPVAAAVELLPRQRAKVEHHAAMPYAEVPAFMAELGAAAPAAGTLALRFTILTAVRSGEVRGATWAEIDLERRTWTIPAERMKAEREHRVPLSPAAVSVLRQASEAFGADGLVFPARDDKPLSDMTLTAALRRRGLPYTVHGFRSSFRDWCAEQGVPREIAERCLAHAVKDDTEAAYLRTDALEQRRPVMRRWAEFLKGKKP